MSARIAAFLVWAAVAACVAFWGLRLFVTPRGVPAQAQPVSVAGSQRGDILRLFALAPEASAQAAPSEPALAARFKLIGVMAPKDAQSGREQGVALIAVDDKPPRAYRVGARVDNALVLQSVAARSAVIGPARGAAAVQLDLPLPVPPATGTLPTAEGFIPASPPVLVPPAVAPPPGGVAPGMQQPAAPQQPAASLGQPAVVPQGALGNGVPVPAEDPSNRR